MNKVDTEYKLLSEVPSAVVQFYEEETRERIVGHTEPDEDGNNMNETIAFAKRHDRMDDTTEWITVGNNPITLMYHQIEAIKDAYVLRMAELFKQYSTWCAGDMQSPFEFVRVIHE